MNKKVGVVGSGMMGREISLCFAVAGYEVWLNDTSMEILENARGLQSATIDKEIRRGRMSEDTNKEEILNRIHPTTILNDMKDCLIVTEAVSEIVELKQDIFRQLDLICDAETFFASNTSSILITKLQTAVSDERKKKMLGMHYFSPAIVMKLVEVVKGHMTSQATVDKCLEIAKSIGKIPITVKDNTGFAVNRIVTIYLDEAVRLVEEGVASVEDIDIACKVGLGFPIGPFEFLDVTDIHLHKLVNDQMVEEH